MTDAEKELIEAFMEQLNVHEITDAYLQRAKPDTSTVHGRLVAAKLAVFDERTDPEVLESCKRLYVAKRSAEDAFEGYLNKSGTIRTVAVLHWDELGAAYEEHKKRNG